LSISSIIIVYKLNLGLSLEKRGPACSLVAALSPSLLPLVMELASLVLESSAGSDGPDAETET
jgi:hypothetical protein